MTSEKITKAESNYRPARDTNWRCGNCTYYTADEEHPEMGSCDIVRGPISTAYVCNYWEEETDE